MEFTGLTNLTLNSPLIYEKIEELPSEIQKNGDFLLFFKLDPKECCSILPEKSSLLRSIIFTGSRRHTETASVTETEALLMPQGEYIFMQCRDNAALKKEDWLDMAIELQKDGLWERNKLNNELYIRFLFEDGMFVTQIFRPVLSF
jgi:hypothetical protein